MGIFTKTWWGQTMHNRLIALILAMVVFVPLVATPVDNRVRGLAALAFEGLSLLLLVLLLGRTAWTLSRQKVTDFLKTGANLPVLLFAALAGLSCLFAARNGYGAQEMMRLGAGVLLYFAVAYQFRRSEQLTRLVDVLLFVTGGAALLGFAQYSSSSSLHSTGLFGDHQLFGSFLMLLLPIAGVMAITERNPNRQLAAQVATVCAVTCLLLSQARSAWLGAAASLIVLGVLAGLTASHRRHTAPRRHEVVLPALLIVAAAGFFLLLWPQTGQIVARVSTLTNVEQQATVQIREKTWSEARRMLAAHPLTGIGLGQYPVQQRQFTREGLPLSQIGGSASLQEQAHNFYLQTAAELGIPGLLLFLSVLVAFWVQGARRVRQMDQGVRRSLLIGALAASVGFAVDAFASPSYQLGQVSMFVWLILGLGVGCLRPRSHGEREEETANAAWTVPTRVARPATALAALGFAALLPTFVLAGTNTYVKPTSAAIRPKSVIVRSGQSATFSLFVTFSDGSTRDVTLATGTSGQTTFTKTGGQGALSGPNNRIYTSLVTEKDTLTVTGTYTQAGNSPVSDTATVLVR